MIEKLKSKCCNASVELGGIPDFIESKEVCTVTSICSSCGKPCDILHPKSKKRKASIKKDKLR